MKRRQSSFFLTSRVHISSTDSDWNDGALQGVYIKGSVEERKDELADETPDLKTLISLTTCLDNRLRERWRDRIRFIFSLLITSPASLTNPTVSVLERVSTPWLSAVVEEIIQLGCARLIRSERQRRLSERVFPFHQWVPGPAKNTKLACTCRSAGEWSCFLLYVLPPHSPWDTPLALWL